MKEDANGNKTYYVRDAGGTLLSVYTATGTQTPQQQEVMLYGSGRLGMAYKNAGNYEYMYELKDHLGTVRAVFTAVPGSSIATTDVADYYPFGLRMRGNLNSYRFGYQGEYAEDETEETGWNAFEARLYDPVIGRWLSVDPARQYFSPFVAMGNNPIGTIDLDGRNGVPVFDKDGNVTYYLPDVDFCPGCEEQHTYSSGFWDFMGRLDAMVQGNAYINDAPINVVMGGKRGTGDNGWRKNPNATKTIHMTEEEVELLTMFLARAPNIYTHKDGRSLTDQRNTSVSKYTTNPLAKEISVKSRLEIQINNLLEETQKQQSMVHGTFYSWESKNRPGRIYKYSYMKNDSILFVRKINDILDTGVYHKDQLYWLGDSSSYGGVNNY